MSDSVISDATPSRSSFGWVRAVVIGAAGLFYAYGVWNSFAYLLTMAQLGLNAYGWFVLIFSVFFPILVFAIAYTLGRRRGTGELSIVLIAGLGLVAVFWMNVVAFSALNFASLSV